MSQALRRAYGGVAGEASFSRSWPRIGSQDAEALEVEHSPAGRLSKPGGRQRVGEKGARKESLRPGSLLLCIRISRAGGAHPDAGSRPAGHARGAWGERSTLRLGDRGVAYATGIIS